MIFFLSKELNQALGRTLGVLHECGFKVKLIEDRELDGISNEKTILIGKHPSKKHNGDSKHRRRFAFYRYHGFRAIGYADGAECKIDYLWWRDLHCKLSHLIEDSVLERERLSLTRSLDKLRELGK